MQVFTTPTSFTAQSRLPLDGYSKSICSAPAPSSYQNSWNCREAQLRWDSATTSWAECFLIEQTIGFLGRRAGRRAGYVHTTVIFGVTHFTHRFLSRNLSMVRLLNYIVSCIRDTKSPVCEWKCVWCPDILAFHSGCIPGMKSRSMTTLTRIKWLDDININIWMNKWISEWKEYTWGTAIARAN